MYNTPVSGGNVAQIKNIQKLIARFFIKLYKIKERKEIPGTGQDTGTESKPARVEVFKKAVEIFPFLFKFDFMKGGYYRLAISTSKFNEHAQECKLPAYTLYPVVFTLQQQLAKAKEYDAQFWYDTPEV